MFHRITVTVGLLKGRDFAGRERCGGSGAIAAAGGWCSWLRAACLPLRGFRFFEYTYEPTSKRSMDVRAHLKAINGALAAAETSLEKLRDKEIGSAHGPCDQSRWSTGSATMPTGTRGAPPGGE
jgi:hypothetical protein